MDSLPLTSGSTRETSKTSQSLKLSPQETTRELSGLVGENQVLHMIIEREVQKMGYGNITVNVELKNGVANLKTLNLVTNKRIRY